uniref:Uncharacterized protein n=1 Tax=Arundo donax TaxID=35708 RepID=A0A0A9GF22_ARUDO
MKCIYEHMWSNYLRLCTK